MNHHRFRSSLLLILLCCSGFLGNYFSLSFGFNVHFIFGSIFTILAISLLGAGAGVSVTVIASTYTYLLWNHPYAIIIFVAEALWLGLILRKRKNQSLYLLDLKFWLCLGIPMVFFFYLGVMKLTLIGTCFIAMKQSLNGISNAILATLLLYSPLLKRYRSAGQVPPRPTSQIIFEFMALMLLISSIGGLIYMNKKDVKQAELYIANSLKMAAQNEHQILDGWLSLHVSAVQNLTARGVSLNFESDPLLQEETKEVHQLFPGFHNMFLADTNATTLAFNPPRNELNQSTIGLNFSDRFWFRQLMQSKKIVISDVFTGRGGVFEPIITISVPGFYGDDFIGFGLGAINLSDIANALKLRAEQRAVSFTVLDRKGNIVFSSVPERLTGHPFNMNATGGKRELAPGVFLNLPQGKSNVTGMKNWSQAVLFSTSKIESAGWTLLTEGSLAPVQSSIYQSSVLNFSVIYFLLLGVSGASVVISRYLSEPLRVLARISAGIPEKIESGKAIHWPCVANQEISALIDNFKMTADVLREQIYQQRNQNAELENTVQKRTAELALNVEEKERANQLMKTFFDLAPLGICWIDEKGAIQYQNEQFRELSAINVTNGFSINEWFSLVSANWDSIKEVTGTFHSLILAAQQIGSLELWLNHPEGERCCYAYRAQMPDGKCLLMMSDMTEQKHYEVTLDEYAQAKSVLLEEVNHRVKNNLTILLSMLNLAIQQKAYSPEQFYADFSSRIHALSLVHSLLSSTKWDPIRLADLCRQIVQTNLPDNARVIINPSEVRIASDMAHNLALVINEISTNSSKHAAIKGNLEVTIDISADLQYITLTYGDNGPGYTENVLAGKVAKSSTGINMIKGIVTTSLYGSVTFTNCNGAFVTIQIPRQPE